MGVHRFSFEEDSARAVLGFSSNTAQISACLQGKRSALIVASGSANTLLAMQVQCAQSALFRTISQ